MIVPSGVPPLAAGSGLPDAPSRSPIPGVKGSDPVRSLIQIRLQMLFREHSR